METLNPSKYLSREERQQLLQKDNWKASWEVFHTWVWIALAFVLAGFFPSPLTIIIALFILGGKQLACSIIMHDASHYAMFKDKKLNDFVGKWLGSYPVFNDVIKYRPYHFKHHVTTGTKEDPDISLTWGYPTHPVRMARKIFRDLIGATGIKTQFALLAIHFGFFKYSMSRVLEKEDQSQRSWKKLLKLGVKNLSGPITCNLILFGVLWMCGAAWLYLLWIGALLTTFNFSVRIRSIAEHSVVKNPEDPLRNTRTTYANWLERLLFAPHHVNYHLEHHMMMSVPSYNLSKMHELLKKRGFYEKAGLLENGYWEILKLAVKSR